MTHGDETTECDYVIVAVPLGVLKAGSIEFVPGLPSSKSATLDKFALVYHEKVVLVWDRTFWKPNFLHLYTPKTSDSFFTYINMNKYNPKSNALMTLTTGEACVKVTKMTDSELTAEIMTLIRDFLGSDSPDPIKIIRTNWLTDENYLGAFHVPLVGAQNSDKARLSEEIDNKVFFAGDYTVSSRVHGAIQSGEREA